MGEGEQPDEAPSAWQELAAIARQINGASVRAMEEAKRLPNASDFATRLLEVVGAVHLLAADGQRASAEVELRRLRDLVTTKDAFVRLTTHELRRPLGVVKGYISMLEDGTYGELPEKVHMALKQISAGRREMENLIEGLATIGCLEDRGDVLRLAPYRLGQLVAEVVAAVEVEAQAKQIRIESEISTPDPEVVIDADRLRIALVNLVANAVKYSPEQSVVSISSRQDASEATVTVSDQGPGIDPAEASLLFAPWQRGSGITAPGLGLGLDIARRLVEMHRGKLTVGSAPGGGSAFSIVLPH